MNPILRKKIIFIGILCLLVTSLAFSPACPYRAGPYRAGSVTARVAQTTSPAGSWIYAAAMTYTRGKHTATLLNSGKVLVFGGYPGDYSSAWLSPELYDPSTNTWLYAGKISDGGAYQTDFYDHTATLLMSGEVLMVGGKTYPYVSFLTWVELYDPTTNTWSLKAHTNTARVNHTATLLPSGMVLVAGGNATGDQYNTSLASTEIYDAHANTWIPAAPMLSPRQNHFAILLKNGKVLVGSGTSSDLAAPLTSTEIYDPIAKTWSPAAEMNTAHLRATPILMPDGKVFVAGGTNVSAYQSAEMYDPTANKWTALADMPLARKYNVAVLLQTSQVLLAGGDAFDNTNHFKLNAEVYTPSTNTWSPVAQLNQPHFEAAAVVLQTGQVLLTGGYDADVNYANLTYTKSVELYQPPRRIYLPDVRK